MPIIYHGAMVPSRSNEITKYSSDDFISPNLIKILSRKLHISSLVEPHSVANFVVFLDPVDFSSEPFVKLVEHKRFYVLNKT